MIVMCAIICLILKPFSVKESYRIGKSKCQINDYVVSNMKSIKIIKKIDAIKHDTPVIVRKAYENEEHFLWCVEMTLL